jgi:FAD/FMN-containing dehydrogenase
VIVEATFKSRPRPEREAFVQQSFADLADAIRLVDAVESKLNPVVLDLHNLTHTDESSRKQFSMVLGFAGAREDVECELTRAAELGTASEGNLEHENIFWSTDSSEPTHKQSVLPSKLTHLLRELGPVPFVARAGNGIVHYRGGPVPPRAMLPRHLFQRVKDTFDPKHLFPSLPQ